MPLIVLMLVALVDQIEANLTAGLVPLLQAEFGVSDAVIGTLPAAEAIVAVVVSLPAGYLADRSSRTRMIAVVVAVWSVITLGSAVAVGFAMLYATRVVLASASNLEDPAAASLLGDYYPPRTRGRAYGYHRLAFFAGGSLGVMVGAAAGEAVGWRGAYLLAAVPGLIVAVACRRLAEPARGRLDRRSGDREPADAHGDPVPGGLRPFLRELRSLPLGGSLGRVLAGLTALFLGITGIAFWWTSYYVRTWDVSLTQAGTLTVVVDLMGMIGGTVAGGLVGDRWDRKITGARILVGGTGICCGSALWGAGLLAGQLVPQLVVFTAGGFLLAMAIPNLNAAIADLLPPWRRGIGFACLQILVTVGAAFGAPLVGVVSDATGSLAIGFGIAAFTMAVGGLVVLTARSGYDAAVDRARAANRRHALSTEPH